jgi:hypothetical protein
VQISPRVYEGIPAVGHSAKEVKKALKSQIVFRKTFSSNSTSIKQFSIYKKKDQKADK